MPPVSRAQAGFMYGCKHNPEHMQGKCPPPAVVAEFTKGGASLKGLPARAQRPKSSPPPTDGELRQGYRALGGGF